jgi:hypothetical protein
MGSALMKPARGRRGVKLKPRDKHVAPCAYHLRTGVQFPPPPPDFALRATSGKPALQFSYEWQARQGHENLFKFEERSLVPAIAISGFTSIGGEGGLIDDLGSLCSSISSKASLIPNSATSARLTISNAVCRNTIKANRLTRRSSNLGRSRRIFGSRTTRRRGSSRDI